jgi:DNA helicase-2/ATP-dependent DNA helicase PcrA
MEQKNTAEQQAVISAGSSDDVLVVAGAGSGKTYTMTERIIALITNPEPGERVAANSILGLTFTNKAAQELQNRVIERVSQVAGAGAGSAAGAGDSAGSGTASGAASRVEALTMRPEVMTYDAFFQQIVRQYGLLIGVDQSVMPLSDAGRYELASRVVSESMAEIFSGFDADDDASDSGTPGGVAGGTSDGGTGDGEEEQPVSRFDTLVNGILQISDECLSYMIDETHLSFDDAVHAAQEWNDAFIQKATELVNDALEEDPEAEAILDAPKEPTVGSRARKEEKRLPELEMKLRRRALYRTNALLKTAKERKVLLRLAKKYNERKRENHFAEFSDFTVYALQLLVRFPSIGSEYRRRYTHVFLDEYQDTSTTQAKLIARLFHPGTAALTAQNNTVPNTAVPNAAERSSVTAVGDPFQSIYAWRGASPGAFSLFRQDFDLTQVEPQPLTYSVRNPQLVLDLANAITSPLRSQDRLSRKGAHSSSRIKEVDVNKLNVLDTQAHPAAQGSVAAAGFSSRSQEAAAIARFAKKYSEHYKDDEDTPVAVLVRSKGHMSEYAEALAEAGLDYEIVGFSDVMHQPEIQDLFALLRAATDHTATAPLMRLLASPRYGISGSQMRVLAQAAEEVNMEQQYAALVAAGIGTGHDSFAQQRALVHEHRDRVPTMVSLVDLLVDDNLGNILAKYPHDAGARLDESVVARILSFSRALRRVEAAQNSGVSHALHEAVEALDLDVDLVVSAALHGDSRHGDSKHSDSKHSGGGSDRALSVTRSQVESRLDVIFQMVDTYSAELPAGVSPTLRGFVEWVGALAKDPQEPAISTGKRADVVVMTIHQAKGLGWRAVAIAGMSSSVFPSSKSLTLRDDTSSADERDDMYFTATSTSWIEQASAVPAPMRSDAQILPRFPHAASGNPLTDLQMLASASDVDAEVYEMDGPQEEVGQSRDFLSLREEYGSRAHADERRLAYVAVTRSKDAALLSFSGHQSKARPDAGIERTDIRPDAAGTFWRDAASFIAHSPGATTLRLADDEWKEAEGSGRQCCGAVAGQDSEALSQLLFTQAEAITEEDLDTEAGKGSGAASAWPLSLDDATSKALSLSADAVRHAGQRAVERVKTIMSAGASDASGVPDATDATGASDAPESPETYTEPPLDPAGEMSLLGRAVLLSPPVVDSSEHTVPPGSAVSDGKTGDVPPSSHDAMMAELRHRAAAVLPKVSLGATQLQRLSSQSESSAVGSAPGSAAAADTAFAADANEKRELLGILRPVPQAPNFAADMGTRFHAWAEQLLDEDQAAPAFAEAEEEESTAESAVDSGKMARWQHNLANSAWVERPVEALEDSFVINVFGLRVVARIDAVFRGVYRGDDLQDGSSDAPTEPRYTIVDWKTGRKPNTEDSKAHAQVQLDLYRLALSRNYGIDIANVDACLYYVNQDEPEQRTIYADVTQSETDILERLRAHSDVLKELSGEPET